MQMAPTGVQQLLVVTLAVAAALLVASTTAAPADAWTAVRPQYAGVRTAGVARAGSSLMATSSRMFEPLAGATVDGSLLFGSDTANYFDPATTSFQTGESLVPLGFGNSATPCLQGLPCSSKVAVRNDWTEFAFSSEGDVLIKRVDLTTSGLLTLTDTTAGIGINAKYTVTLRSSAFTAFQDVLSVISDGFMPGWVVTATLAGDTLTIQVPDRDLLDAGDLGTVTYTIRLGPPQCTSGGCCDTTTGTFAEDGTVCAQAYARIWYNEQGVLDDDTMVARTCQGRCAGGGCRLTDRDLDGCLPSRPVE